MSLIGEMLVKKILEIPYLKAGFEALHQLEIIDDEKRTWEETLDEIRNISEDDAEMVAGFIKMFDAVAETARRSL